MLVLLFTTISFLSAFLLFSIQPLFGKMVLPLLGGAPAVWNTCMVFFQAALLAGYALVHALTSRLGVRRHQLLHSALLFIPFLVLPVRIPHDWLPNSTTNPIPWLLCMMTVTVGLPFLLLSMSAPLLQRWFSHTSRPGAHDPYFLYAASNLGSLIALLSYPFLIEPTLTLRQQTRLWTLGYGLFLLLILWCLRMTRRDQPKAPWSPADVRGADVGPPTMTQRLWWLALSFAPSSLLLGVTTHLSTDLAAIPLLWVIPFAIYLLTWVLVFAKRRLISHTLMVWGLPFAVLPLTFAIHYGQAWLPILLLHLVLLFVSGMVCHGELARRRPPPQFLTEFYVWVSVGGVLGGVFNALVAPLMFRTVMEYPLAIMLVCLLRPGTTSKSIQPRPHWLDAVWPWSLWVVIAGCALLADRLAIEPLSLKGQLIHGPAALLCYAFRYRPLRFGLGVAMLLLVGRHYSLQQEKLLYVERTFFGVHRVTQDAEGRFHSLSHGTTTHGMQSLDPSRQREPLTYYHPTGPAGQVFDAFVNEVPILDRIAVIGLGAGSLACYASPGQDWVFYEIDPAVKRIATDPRWFTFLHACLERVQIVMGDARLTLARAEENSYRMILVDAFSSDAIPVHLITQEAVRLYFSKLADNGWLVLHISNRFMDLEPMVGAIAQQEGFACLAQYEKRVGHELVTRGKTGSHWVVMARHQTALRELTRHPQWHPASTSLGIAAWTDEFSNFLAVLRRN